MTTHSREEQLAWVARLRAALEALPAEIPDAYLDDIVQTTLSLEAFAELRKPGPKPAPYVHLYER
jgi:hypothetical protein